MTILLPRLLKRYVDKKVSSGAYRSAGEFVREAIRERCERDQQRDEAGQVLAAKLLEGLDSGKPIPFTKSHFKLMRAALVKQIGRRAGR
jgi:putative addiction module CopG family antidote